MLIIIGTNSFLAAQHTTTDDEKRTIPNNYDTRIVQSSMDANHNKIADGLDVKISANLSNTKIQRPLSIEVLIGLDHAPQIQDIERITNHGGRVINSWSDVVYSIHALLPMDQIQTYAADDSVVLIEENAPVSICLDESVSQIQIRPRVWDTYGYQGNNSHAVAVFDTGIDDSHPDLSGKLVTWKDFSSEAYPTAVDYGEHGSHCAGIIAGTGSASSASTKKYTTALNDYSYFRFNVDSFSHRTYVVMNTSGNLEVNLDWDDDLPDDGYGTASIWIDTDQDELRESSEYGSSGPPFSFSRSVDAGQYLIGIAAHDYDSWQEDFFCQITVATQAHDDGHNLLCGVAPQVNLAGMKILNSDGTGSVDDIIDGINWLSQNAETYGIIAASMSLGLNAGEINANLDTAVNNLVSSGVVCVVAAGNSQGSYYVPSPGAAAKAITVGAVNDVDALTEYSSIGNPGRNPLKPDVLAPGGSWQTGDEIISVDSNDADKTYEFDDDKYPDDYRQSLGTSMACPHVSGLAALVAEALGDWNYSQSHALKVKQLILMTCYEIGSAETSGFTPSFDHGGKDNKEGYGRVCGDAAVEAASMCFDASDNVIALGSEITEKKVWARQVPVRKDKLYTFSLTVPETADYDLYLYDGSPDVNGEPVLLNVSFQSGSLSESILRFSDSNQTWYLVVKWRSGTGNATVNITRDLPCSFSYLPSTPTTQDVIRFNDTSSDAEITSWSWTFGDENTSILQHPTHRYVDDGSYVVNLTITGPYSITNTTSHVIIVENVGPVANFSVHPLHPTTRDPINLTDGSTDVDGTIVSWFWEFGDGANSTNQHPIHQYADNGTYAMLLNVTDDDGAWNCTSWSITVNNTPPDISFNYSPQFPEVGESVIFNATINETDGTIQNITWEINGTQIAYTANFSHVFSIFETMQIHLSITDDDQATSSLSSFVVLKNSSINRTQPGTLCVINQTRFYDLQVQINTTNQTNVTISRYSSNPTTVHLSSVSLLGTYYDISVENSSQVIWPVGINVFYDEDQINALGINETQLVGLYYFDPDLSEWVVFNQTGKNVSFQMGYDGYLWAETWHLTTIIPAADTTGPGNITGLVVSDDHDGKLGLSWDAASDNIGISHYQIFVDGNLSVNTTDDSTTHQLTGLANGVSYSLSVRAVDVVGNFGNMSEMVNATPTRRPRPSSSGPSGGVVVMAPVVNADPIADPGGPYEGITEVPVAFDASESSDPDGSIESVVWDFGDGTSAEGVMVNHTFTELGNYTITVKVMDEQGVISENVTYVLIDNIPPDIPVVFGPKTGRMGRNLSFQIIGRDENHEYLRVYIDWDDGNSSMVPSYEAGAVLNVSHQWHTAGLYDILVFSVDPVNGSSQILSHQMLINGVFCSLSGYLLDEDDDGRYEWFRDNVTGNVTMVEERDDGYVLDMDGDGVFDHMVVIESGLSTYEEDASGTDTPGFGLLFFLFALVLLVFWKRKKRG